MQLSKQAGIGNQCRFHRGNLVYRCVVKRSLDVGAAVVLLPFVALLLFVLVPVIRLTDRGPAFYCSPRMGLGGKVFMMYKLRSMSVGSPDRRNPDGSAYCSANDSRVTRVGRLLRKTSLDELPQLFNVLKGDMSFVGPRPNLAGGLYIEFDDVRRKRLAVRPGITGYSQAFFRNAIPQDEKYKYDCYYVDSLCFSLDLQVIMRTIKTVIKRQNVYAQHESGVSV